MRSLTTFAALLVAAQAASVAAQAQAPSAALAKKCRELAVKAHPPATAGTRTGSAAAEREYFAACVQKGGQMDKDSAGSGQ